MGWELRSARYLAADVLERVVQPGDTVIDATVGNGHDTQYLAELVGENGTVVGFDVQQDAITSARKRLTEAGLIGRCRLICMGHQHMAEQVEGPVRAVVFNLGWLPGGNKAVTTLWETTSQAVQAALGLLVKGGICTICAYPGHAAGDVERASLTDFLSALRPQEFNVLHQHFLNAGPGSPECFVIQKQ